MEIGGLPVVRLQAEQEPTDAPRFLSAEILPGRGMMLLQARAFLPGRGEVDVLAAPALQEAARQMDGGPEDFAGNRSFAFGGAILLPFANRIRGRPVGDRAIAADLGGQSATLPANWSGKAPGSQAYAMHGLLLAAAFADVRQTAPNRVEGRLDAGDFGGRWPSRCDVTVIWTLTARALELQISVSNLGEEILPLGIGWHPYFTLPSGERRQARLRLPAGSRLEVSDYDAVLPTGVILPAEGLYDFRHGAALGDLYLDDCFVELERDARGDLVIEIEDPAAGYGIRLATNAPAVKAVQVYAPPQAAFIVVEPQFNWADPFSPLWPKNADTGMARIAPGEARSYRVTTTPFTEREPINLG